MHKAYRIKKESNYTKIQFSDIKKRIWEMDLHELPYKSLNKPYPSCQHYGCHQESYQQSSTLQAQWGTWLYSSQQELSTSHHHGPWHTAMFPKYLTQDTFQKKSNDQNLSCRFHSSHQERLQAKEQKHFSQLFWTLNSFSNSQMCLSTNMTNQ